MIVVLAALAVDATIAFLAERELANATAAAANDAATAALDDRAFYESNRIEVDQQAVEVFATRRVLSALDGDRHRDIEIEALAIAPQGDGCPWTVRVTASSQIKYLFSAAVPGAPRHVRVEASSTATPSQGEVASRCGIT